MLEYLLPLTSQGFQTCNYITDDGEVFHCIPRDKHRRPPTTLQLPLITWKLLNESMYSNRISYEGTVRTEPLHNNDDAHAYIENGIGYLSWTYTNNGCRYTRKQRVDSDSYWKVEAMDMDPGFLFVGKYTVTVAYPNQNDDGVVSYDYISRDYDLPIIDAQFIDIEFGVTEDPYAVLLSNGTVDLSCVALEFKYYCSVVAMRVNAEPRCLVLADGTIETVDHNHFRTY